MHIGDYLEARPEMRPIVRARAMLEKTTALHLSNRLGFGPAPGDLGRIADTGFDNYIQSPLHPQTGNRPTNVTSQLRSLPSFGKDTGALYAEYWWKAQVPDPKAIPQDEKKKLKRREKQPVKEAQNARLLRAIASPWQLHEALVEFWFNHFNVYEKKGPDKVWVVTYEDEPTPPHPLGCFSDLLPA